MARSAAGLDNSRILSSALTEAVKSKLGEGYNLSKLFGVVNNNEMCELFAGC